MTTARHPGAASEVDIDARRRQRDDARRAAQPGGAADTVVRIGGGIELASDQGRYPVHQHEATGGRQRLAVIDRNLNWVASCYGMR